MAEKTSKQNQPTASIQDPNDAYNVLHNQVYAPAFFEKLASDYNIQPQTQDEALTLLKMASWLRDMHDQQEKTASTNLLSGAAENLRQHAIQRGLIDPRAQQKQATASRAFQYAAQASMDPQLVHAVLSLQAAGQAAAS